MADNLGIMVPYTEILDPISGGVSSYMLWYEPSHTLRVVNVNSNIPLPLLDLFRCSAYRRAATAPSTGEHPDDIAPVRHVTVARSDKSLPIESI